MRKWRNDPADVLPSTTRAIIYAGCKSNAATVNAGQSEAMALIEEDI